jgi:hypothetical protein
LNRIIPHDKVYNRIHEDMNTLLPFKSGTRRRLIDRLIRLSARRLHRRSPRAVQNAVLNRTFINKTRHFSSERVKFTHEVALSQPPDRGVAGHRADAVRILRYEKRAKPQSTYGERGFNARVSPANYYAIVVH